MVVKVSREVAEAIRVKRNYGFTNGRLLDMSQNNDFTTLNSECLNSNNISLTVLCEALYEGYEIEKPKYTENNIPRHFKFKIANSEFFYDRYNGVHVVMWKDDISIKCSTHTTNLVLNLLNTESWTDIEIIEQ